MAKAKILVVEDEIVVAKAIQLALQRHGYDVPATVSSGLEAIQKTAEIQPDLILMDVVLKGDMDGIEAAEQIRSRFDIPVVYLTAYTSGETIRRAKMTEPFGYITKPFDETQLHTNIEMALYKHKMDKALRKSESEKELILSALSEQITYLDKNLRIVWANRAAGDSVGQSPDELVGHYCYEVWYQRQEACVDCPVAKSIETGEPAEGEMTLPDGRIWFIRANPVRDEKGEVAGVVETALEITQRKQAEEALHKEKVFAESIVQTAQAIILVLNPQGRIVSFNPYMEKISGYQLEEVRGKDWFDTFLPRQDRHRIRELFSKAVSGIQTKGDINPIITKDGELRQIEWYDKTLKDADGKLIGMLAIGQDITERKRAEKELLDYQNRLKSLAWQSSLVEERERRRIAEGLHDDITQALISVKMRLAQLYEDITTSQVTEDIDGFKEYIDELIHKTRSLAFELSSPVLYEVGLEAAIRGWLTKEIEQKYDIKTEFEDDGSSKPLDENVQIQLFRSVRELLVNVIRHAQAQKIKITMRKEEDRLKIAVEDDGTGFERLEGDSGFDETSGFGLFSIHENLSQLGGVVEIESKVGQGTVVVLTAPLKSENGHK